MRNIFSVIFMNFWGFDLLIFIAALFNGFVFYMVKRSADKLKGMMNHNIFVPHFGMSCRDADEQVFSLREEDVIAARDTSGRFYSLFVNITGIFPLLGILGTVVSLLGLVSDMDNVTGNFYGALTSTFWGLIFAIIFKFLDGVISPLIENNEKSVQIYLENAEAIHSALKEQAAGNDEAVITPEQPVDLFPAEGTGVFQSAREDSGSEE